MLLKTTKQYLFQFIARDIEDVTVVLKCSFFKTEEDRKAGVEQLMAVAKEKGATRINIYYGKLDYEEIHELSWQQVDLEKKQSSKEEPAPGVEL